MNGEEIPFLSDLRGVTPGLIAICILVLVASMVSAERYWDDVDIEVMGSWTDPGGGGQDLRFDVSTDGTRIVLAGHAAANDVLVADRDMNVLATLVSPDQGLIVEGVRWSESGKWVCAWGTADGMDHDRLWMWDGTSYEPTEELFENFTTPLQRLDSVLFVAYDDILVLAGRDENGTSRVMLWETAWSTVRRDFPWEDNATVLHLGTDMMSIVCIDERGNVSAIGGSDWSEVKDLEGHDAVPTSTSQGTYLRHPWIVGCEDGMAVLWAGFPTQLENSSSFGVGPVQAVAWSTMEGGSYYLLATPEDATRTNMTAYFYAVDQRPDNMVANPIVFPSSMTKMVTDVLVDGQVWCGFSDGTIALVNMTIIPDLPPEVTIEVPEKQQVFKENFLAQGTYWDDHDNVEWIRVRWEPESWFDANFSDGEWSYEVNHSKFDDAELSLEVEIYDGRHVNQTRVNFFAKNREGPDDDEWPPGIPLIPIVLLVLFLALLLMVRAYKRKWGA